MTRHPQASLRRLVLTDHELARLSFLNGAPALEHVVVSGAFRLLADAHQTALPRLASLVLENTYQADPPSLPAPLFAALPSLRHLVLSQSEAHLARVAAVRPEVQADIAAVRDAGVLPTLRFAHAVGLAPTLPTRLTPVQTVVMRAGQALRKVVLPTGLVFRATSLPGSGKVSAWTRAAFMAGRPRTSVRVLPSSP